METILELCLVVIVVSLCMIVTFGAIWGVMLLWKEIVEVWRRE